MTLTKKEQRETVWVSLGRINGLAKMIPISQGVSITNRCEKIQHLISKISADLTLLKVNGTSREEYK